MDLHIIIISFCSQVKVENETGQSNNEVEAKKEYEPGQKPDEITAADSPPADKVDR